MIFFGRYTGSTLCDVMLELNERAIMIAEARTPMDTLVEAEKILRTDLEEVQRLLTAEREKTRDATKPVSPTY